MKLEIIVILGTAACVAAIPPDAYSDSHLVDLVEVDMEKRTLDSRKFHLSLFGEHVELNLQRSKDFHPGNTLMVHFLDVDEDGNRVVEDFTHRTGGAKDLFNDPLTMASVMIDELDGRTKLEGSIHGKFVIEPLEGNLSPDDLVLPGSAKVQHRVYKTNASSLLGATPDFIPMATEDDEGDIMEKRQVPAKIYPHIHAVVDYSHYKKLAKSEAEVLNYIRIMYHTTQVAHFSTMSNPACQISLQGITVCKSDAACAELNRGKWSYGEYKYPMDNIGKFAYQERYRTGTDYDVFFVTTSNKICPKPGDCGVGGFGPMPGCCAQFSDYWKKYLSGGIMIDLGGYDSVRGIGHEIGHMLNMPHDSDTSSCKVGDYIMGQTKYSPNNWRYSTCSMAYMRQYLGQSKSNCLKSPPSSNQFGGWPNDALAGRYMGVDDQCKAIFGSGWRGCLSTSSKQDRICQQLPCNTGGPGRGGCSEFHLAAAEGSACGPNMWCQKGYCVPFSNKPWGS